MTRAQALGVENSGISFFYKSTVVLALLRKHGIIEKAL